MTIPSLPNLYPDLHWLIHMKPTRPNLDDYLAGRPPCWAAGEAHQSPFAVSNIFASDPREATGREHLYPVRNHCLAGAEAHNLIIIERTHDVAVKELHARIRSGELVSDFGPINVTEWDGRVHREEEDHRRHNADVTQVCEDLRGQWINALTAYEKMGVEPSDSARMSINLKLYTPLPQEPLPTKELIEQFYQDRNAEALILITARHELTCLYCKVKVWHELACKSGGLNREDQGLSQADLDRLNARAHCRRGADTGRTRDGNQSFRLDAPVEYNEFPSPLAAQYWNFYQWYRDAYATLTDARCRFPGCPYFRGSRPKYCSDKCADKAKKITNRKSHKTAYAAKGEEKKAAAEANKQKRLKTK